MQMPSIAKPVVPVISVPPMYQWPQFLRRVVLTAAIVLCVGVYVTLGAGLISLLVLAINALGR